MRKVSLAAVAAAMIVAIVSLAWAGNPAAKSQAKAMDAMKAEMMKCTVCKNWAPHLDAIGAMEAEAVRLNDGAAIMHTVATDKVTTYHKASAEVHKAGEACMTMTDEQAKTQLCAFCQEIRGVMKSGAKMSTGTTKHGDMMILTSTDPAVQTQIQGLAQKCEMMNASLRAER